MGLAEPRKRIKISHDPNNLTWAQSNSFGQKILASHGWKPGQYLGAKDAKHASHYTAANASHIRIKVKDDNLGLGASPAGKLAESSRQTDAFQGLLGRLNGRSDADIQKEQKKGEDIRLALYAKGKWGGMEFVRGGYLVGGKDKDVLEKESEEEEDSKEEKSKSQTEEDDEDSDAAKRRRKEEKRKRKEARRAQKESAESDNTPSDEQTERESEKEKKRRRKEEKRAAKLEKKSKKESKRKTSKDQEASTPADSAAESRSSKRKHSSDSSSESESDDEDKTKAVVAPSSVQVIKTVAPPPRTGRHLLRGKNILSKRMAFMDASGLDGIFMKAASS